MGQRDLDSTEGLRQELLWTYGPCGQEDAVRTVCARELEPLVDDMWTDDAGNLIGYIGTDDGELRDHRHRSSSIAGGAATRVLAHMDELSMLVKRVEPDCTLHMTQLGVMYPGNFGRRPAQDAYLVFTTNEEIGGVGGSYASATLPGTLTIALDVGPTEREYATTVTGGPIVGYSDALCGYDKDVADRVVGVGTVSGLAPQPGKLGAFMSESSHSKASGLTPRAGLLCLPTLSTHGFEVIPRAAIDDMAGIVADFLADN